MKNSKQRHAPRLQWRAALALWLICIQPLAIFAGDGLPVPEGYTVYTLGRFRPDPNQLTWDPRLLAKVDQMGWDSSGACSQTTVENHLNPVPATNLSNFKGLYWGESDKFNLFSIGTDPANLVPEGVDLNIFPAFPISDQLVLKPSLSYGTKGLWSRRGDLSYGDPKVWSNHYGELVRMLSDTSNEDKPLGPNVTPGSWMREPLPQEIHTWFTNAEGQQLNFYPDPHQFPTQGDSPITNAQTGKPYLNTWYSESGNLRLKDTSVPGDTAQVFELHSPNGLTYKMEFYKTTNGQDVMEAPREYLSAHYRVKRIIDGYGNFVQLDYRNAESLQPTYVRAYNYTAADAHNPTAQPNTADALISILYQYDGESRLTQISLPGVHGNTLTYELRYPDHADGSLVDTGAVTWRNGAQAHAHIADNKVGFDPIQVPGGATAVKVDGLNTFLVDLDDIDHNMRLALRYPRWNEAAMLHADSPFMKVAFGTGQEAFYRLGRENALSPQQTPKLYLERGADHGNHLDTLGLRTNVNTSTAPSSGTDFIPDPNYPDKLSVSALDVTQAAPADTLGALYIYPLIKNGDRIYDGQAFHTINDPKLDIRGDAGFTPEDVQVPGLTVDNDMRILRRDNLDRVAEILFPYADAVPQTGTARKRMRIYYDDQTINHQEIKKVEVYDDSLPDAGYLQKTEYTYQHLWVLPGSEDAFPAHLGGDRPACSLAGRTLLGSTCNDFLQIGLGAGRSEELTILRKKTSTFKDYDGGTLVDQEPLVTQYGGAWNFVLAGGSLERIQVAVEPPAGLAPEEGCDTHNECYLIQWGLSGKPFTYTWAVESDGSAKVFDLDPRGTDIDSMLGFAGKGSRVFKTYYFDQGFKAALEASSNGLTIPEGGLPTPFYRYMPYYTTAQDTAMRANPSYPAAFQTPLLKDLFQASWNAKAFKAEVTHFQPVPLYGYNLSTDASNPNNFFHRETLKALFGIADVVPSSCYGTYYRTSMAKYLHDTVDPNVVDGAIQQFFKGDFALDFQLHHINWENAACMDPATPNTLPATAGCSSCPTGQECRIPYTPYNTVTVDMDWGGRIDMGNSLASYQDRQKLHRLRPGITYTLLDLSGLQWNETMDTIDLDVAKIENLTRYSNGGYIAVKSFPHTDLVKGATTLTHSGLGAIRVGDVFYYGLKKGPSDYYGQRVHTVTAKNGSQITFEPALHATSPAGTVYLSFYRYYNPVLGGTQPVITNSYQGYDWFENNMFSDTFTRPEAFVRLTNKDRSLIPYIYATQATSRTVTDATDWANQDLANWRYFGRVTRSWNGHRLPMFHDGITTALGLDQGILTEFLFDTSAFPWLPTHTKINYEPFTLLYEDNPEPPANKAPHIYDQHEETSYYLADATNSRQKGRPSSKVRYFGNAPQTNEENTFFYDSMGFERIKDSVKRLNGTSDYGMRQESQKDPATGLPLVEISKTWIFNGSNEVSNITTQGSVFKEYNALGKPLRTWNNDARNITGTKQIGASEDRYLFGPVTHFAYHNPLQTETWTTALKDSESSQLTRSIQWTDGMGKETFFFKQHGAGTPFWGTAKTYDVMARLERTYSYKNFHSNPNSEHASAELAFANTPYSLTHYNDRGMEAGTTDTRLEDGVLVDNGTAWRYHSQKSNGDRAVYQLVFDEQATVTRANIKEMCFDRFGHINRVRDYEKVVAQPFFTQAEAEAIIEDFITTPEPPLASAVYSYDRFENVYQAETGLDSLGNPTQQREFYYDQLNRLRLEHQPEMDNGIHYDDFDLFLNPRVITDGTRVQTWTYNADGKPLTAVFTDSVSGATITDSWTYTQHADLFTGLPKTVSTIESSGRGMAYSMEYDENTGLPVRRAMIHNLPEFNGYGYTSNIQTPEWTNALILENVFDFTGGGDGPFLGRLAQMNYPHGQEATPPLGSRPEVAFTYSDYGLLPTSARENTLGLDLATGLNYERESDLTQFNYAPLAGNQYGGSNAYNAQNQLEKQTFTLPSSSGIETQRHYQYDRLDRIKSFGYTAGSLDNVFTYDALEQLSQATVKGYDGTDLVDFGYTYTYGTEGLGNLVNVALTIDGTTAPPISRNVLSGRNRISDVNGTTFTYNAFGELTNGVRFADQQPTDTFSMAYSPKGRISTYLSGSTQENYFYDPAGMRIFSSDTSGGQTTHTLYFYDNDNQVTTEWISKGTPRWNKHYFYLSGKTSVTYEWDQAAAESSTFAVPNLDFLGNAQVPAPELILLENYPSIRWSLVNSIKKYDLEVATLDGDTLKTYQNLQGLDKYYTTLKLPYGTYYLRIRAEGGPFSQWVPHTLSDSGLVLQYTLDGHMNDGVGDLDGFLSNVPTTGGVFDRALYFNGAKYGSVSPIRTLPSGTEPRTVMGWAKPDSLTTGVPQTLFDYGSNEYSGQPDLERMRLQIMGDQLQLSLGQTLITQNIDPSVHLTANTWNHWAVTYSGTEWKLFLNGALVGNLVGSANTDNHRLTLAITQPVNLYKETFQGALDNVEVFDKALADSQVLNGYKAGL